MNNAKKPLKNANIKHTFWIQNSSWNGIVYSIPTLSSAAECTNFSEIREQLNFI